MNKYLTLSLIAAGLSVSAAGFAADHGAPNPSRDSQAVFKKLDTNNDDQLTAAEMTQLPEVMKQQRLDRIDTNHDGKIEKSEFEAQAKARADRMFARLDQNGDGSISVDEMKSPTGRHHHGDLRHDDRHESAKSDAMAGKSGHRDPHRWGHHGHHGKPSTDEIFAYMDSNNDGYVSAQEWNQAAQRWRHHHGLREPMPSQDRNQGQSQND